MAAHPIRVIADDLTGAADAGAALLVTGEGVTLTLAGGGCWEDIRRPIVAADTGTRDGDAGGAAVAVAVLARSAPAGTELFKKVDSALRGHLAAEVAALCRCRPGALVVLAPAFPGNGRTTRAGVQHIHGVALHLGEHWAAEPGDPPRSLAELLTGWPSRPVALEVVRAAPRRLAAALAAARGEGRVAICDAETDGDLDRIVAAGSAPGSDVVWVGSAGLASALGRGRIASRARSLGEPVRAGNPDVPAASGPRTGPLGDAGPGSGRPAFRRAGPYLAVIGSAAAAARRQASVLANEGGARMIELDGATLAGAGPAVLAELGDAVQAASARGDTVVTVTGRIDPRLAPAIATSLVRVTAVAAAAAPALVLAGGSTARAVLDACGVTGLELMAELDPGIVLARSMRRPPVPVITKSGAFGDDRTLLRAVRTITPEEGPTPHGT